MELIRASPSESRGLRPALAPVGAGLARLGRDVGGFTREPGPAFYSPARSLSVRSMACIQAETRWSAHWLVRAAMVASAPGGGASGQGVSPSVTTIAAGRGHSWAGH